MRTRHFLDIDDLSAPELAAVLDAAEVAEPPQVLAGRGAALVFEKPSTRTRNATEMAVVRLGGHPVTIRGEEVGFDVRETVEDVARTLACYHDVIGARVMAHATLERMAAVSAVPVVNLLSDDAHPMQVLADLLTLRQHWGALSGRAVAWVGDFNNVARSFAMGAALTGIQLRLACPPGYGPSGADLDRVSVLGLQPLVTTRATDVVDGADAVMTDIWSSMGQESEAEARRRAFGDGGYTVTSELMAAAAPAAVFLHCLPAHRGDEVMADVIDGPASLVWPQAANRMSAAVGLLSWVLA